MMATCVYRIFGEVKRDANIELYRCLLTFGIVILHTIGLYSKAWHWLSSMFVWCVPGFVFITGWFGCRFKLSKVLFLYGVALYCFPVSNGIGILCGGGRVGLIDWLKLSWELFRDHWFIHAYVGLMMLAPIIEAALAPIKERASLTVAIKIFGPFLAFVFGWSFLTNYNCMKTFLPPAPTSQMLTLLGVYVVARIFRLTGMDMRFRIEGAALLFIACELLAIFKIGGFNSVIAIGITIGSFVMIRRFPIPRWMSSFVLLVSPGMFSVFLLHAQPWCYKLMINSVDIVSAYGVPKIFSFIIVASITFCAGIIVDLPRRVIVWLFMAGGRNK